MLEIIKAIIYGIVEGVTEWLPISSTGHLILVEQLIPFQGTSEGCGDSAGSNPGGGGAVLGTDMALCPDQKGAAGTDRYSFLFQKGYMGAVV